MSQDVTGRVNSALEGRYRIERELGAGGMATVYLAHDLKHDRKVALKILKPELAAVLGGERFVQEIRVTANLQHPHILPLHDSGAADTFLYYVMPYAEGETLRDRLDREKQLPVDEAVRIAIGVGNALDYAHRREIIHRDIKPANILLQDGEPVVADFGIALAVNAAGGARMTETGLSIGTPHYMSPEQASGDRELDGRSDVYALAAMLYEMLTGDPPFQGTTAQAVLARILTEKPTTVMQVRDSTPYHVATAVDRALSKLPADRFASASQFVEALKRADVTPPTGTQSPTAPTGASATSRAGPLALAGVAVIGLLGGLAVGRLTSPDPVPQVVRATLSFADNPDIVGVGPDQAVAVAGRVTPDGEAVVFVGTTRMGSQLYRRQLSSDVAEAIIGTEGAQEVEVSPDGTELVFYRNGASHIVPITGGVARQIEGVSFGIDWAEDGYLYGTGTDEETLARVPVGGGEVELLAVPDSGYQYYFPTLLPGHRKVLVAHTVPEWTVRVLGDVPERSMLRLLDLETREVTDLVPGAMAYFVPPDLIVYAGVAGPTYAHIDVKSGTLKGAPQPFLPRANGFDVSISETGHLVYVKGAEGGQQVVFVDEDGGDRSAITDVGMIAGAVVSPNGRRVLVSQGNPSDLWVYQLSGEAPIRLTFGDGEYAHPAWSTNGDYAYMTSGNGTASDLYRVRADGLGTPELLRDEDVAVFFPATAPGGDWVVFYELRTETQRDILAMRQDALDEVVEVVATPANERGPALSTDERFMAYVSNGTGIDEVYVTRFPSGEGRWQVSSGGGWEPIWSDDGSRLYFRTSEEYLVADVDTRDGFRVLRTRPLFSTERFAINNQIPLWGVVHGGEGFVMIHTNPVPPELELVLNAATELQGGN